MTVIRRSNPLGQRLSLHHAVARNTPSAEQRVVESDDRSRDQLATRDARWERSRKQGA